MDRPPLPRRSFTKGLAGVGAVALAGLAGCGGDTAPGSTGDASGTTYKIGVLQLTEHGALDQTNEGFVAALGAEGTTAATGKSLVATAANAWAALSNLTEEYGFGSGETVYFANPVDFAKQIGESEVFSAFGISYIENWAGLGTLVSTGSVTAGTIYATVKDNIKVYVAPTDGDDLFGFYSDESGYIAVSHSPELKSLTYDTVAYVGLVFFAEYIDFVVKGTIAPTA